MGRKPIDPEKKVSKKVHVFFTESQREELQQIATENGLTKSGLIKRALEHYLKHLARKKRS
jgi:predicted DNA-binding protein